VLELDRHWLPAPDEDPPRAVPGGPDAGAAGRRPPGDATLEDVERSHILAVLERTDGVIEGPQGAAKVLGLHPNTLRSRMKKLGIRRPHEMS
jgi:formate hydrogenlyase transcriptional activator